MDYLRLGPQYLPRYCWLDLPYIVQQHLHTRYQQCQHGISLFRQRCWVEREKGNRNRKEDALHINQGKEDT
eukprot:1143637-Pelagomonas_calceolata.AAC.1